MFKYDSKFGRFMTKIFDLIMLNVLFLLMSIPIITIGANSTALYAVFLQMIDKNESPVLKMYLKHFKENFRQATTAWLIVLSIIVVLILDLFVISELDGLRRIVVYATVIFLILAVVYSLFIFPMIYKFKNTIWEQSKNVLLLMMGYFPWVLILLVINFGPLMAVYKWLPNAYGLLIYFYLFIGSALTLYLNAFIFNRIFNHLIGLKSESLLKT